MKSLKVIACTAFLSFCHFSNAATLGSESLAGMSSIAVAVEDVGRDAERDGITTAAVKTAIELRLRQERRTNYSRWH